MEDLAYALVLIAIVLGPGIVVMWGERSKADPRMVREIAALNAKVSQLERTVDRMEKQHP